MIRVNSTLRKLTLFGNPLRDGGVEAIANAMKHANSSLMFVYLDRTTASVSLCNEVSVICERNKQLQRNFVHAYLLDVVVALAPLQLPVYVVLEIVDWLPTRRPLIFHHSVIGLNESCMHLVSRFKKVRLIEGVYHSHKSILAVRAKKIVNEFTIGAKSEPER